VTALNIVTIAVPLVGVLVVGLLVPVFLLARTERHRQEDNERSDRLHREDRDAEWARQDEVAAKAAATAEDIAQRADRAAALLLERQDQSATAQQEVARKAAAVAEQANEAARLLSIRQDESYAATQLVAAQAKEAARLLAENTALVAESASETGKKLDTIHALVNSNMTQAMQSEFEAVGRELTGMKELIELRRSLGQEPSQDALTALAKTQAKLAELESNLIERARIQAQVNQQIGLDVITTTSYRRQGDGEKTSVEVAHETQGVNPPGDEPKLAAEYIDAPSQGAGEGEA
jgi:hypothetical protein